MTPLRIIFVHGSRAIFVVCAAWLAIALATGLRGPPELSAADDTRARFERLERELAEIEETPRAPEPPPAWTDELRRRVDPGAVPAVERRAFGPFLAHRRPNLAFDVATVAEIVVRHAPPRDFAGAVTRGRVDLSWTIARDENENVAIARFELERRELPSGAWKSIASIARPRDKDEPPCAFVDDAVAAWTSYEYRLTEIAELAPELALRGLRAAFDERQVVTWAMTAPTPRDSFVAPLRGSVQVPTLAAERAGARKTVVLRVVKFVAELGGFVEQQCFDVPEGATSIGKRETKRGRVVDFTTGAALEEIGERERDTPLGKRKVAFVKLRWPNGVVEEVEDDAPAPR